MIFKLKHKKLLDSLTSWRTYLSSLVDASSAPGQGLPCRGSEGCGRQHLFTAFFLRSKLQKAFHIITPNSPLL